ncbi:MAG TPA: STAS/SEC14 domain-containing protein [Cytophagaceae bacterium]|nr:STAS/SEC14 domain-containing protein [Cytophagaceae bacterium]
MKIPENANVIDWPTSILWFDEDGILCAISKKVPEQTLEEAKESMLDFERLTGGKKVCMLIDITNSSPTSKEMRDYSAAELPKITKALAMISTSALGKMIANLFFGLKPPPYPTKMFSNEKDAKEWLKQYL